MSRRRSRDYPLAGSARRGYTGNMAPNPLRGAAVFLISALLAGPALAVEVVLPGDVGNTGTVNGQAGTVGGLTPGVNGGVSVVPTLGLGLSPQLGVNVTPAPLVRPVVDPAKTISVTLNPPAGYLGHDPQKTVTWHDPFAKAEEEKKAKGTPPAPPAIDRAVKSSPSAGEVDAKLAGAAKDAVTTQNGVTDAQTDFKLQRMYDGSSDKTANDDWEEDTGEYIAAKPHLAHLAPAGKLQPSSNAIIKTNFSPVPPVPKPATVKAWFANAPKAFMTQASGAWKSILGTFSKSAPSITVLPPVDTASAVDSAAEPAVRGEKIVVRSGRGARYETLGYRVLYAPPVAEGLKVKKAADADISVRLERGSDAKGVAQLRERFAVFNGLIEANFAALELIAQGSSKMTVKAARSVLVHVRNMAEAYLELAAGDNEREAEALGMKKKIARLAAELDEAVIDLADSDLLPSHAAVLVIPIEKRSLHKYLNQLHQLALETVGQSDTETPANLTVRMGSGDSEKAVSLVDLSENPLVQGERVVAPGFKALLTAMSRSKDTPAGSLIMQDHQFWGHFKLGAHSAEIYANFLQPDEGGMIRVRYQEWANGYDNQTRLYYVGRLLHKAGFHVDTKNGFLTAVIDKDHAAQTADQMTETFALVVQALHATVGVDFALPILVEGAQTSEEVGRRIDDWVDTVMGEGTLPFYVHDDHDEMVEGWKEYESGKRSRAVLRAALDKNLGSLGLPKIPNEERLGQRTINRFYNEPIEAAIARGELRLGLDRKLTRNPAYNPLADLAASVSKGALGAAKMAEVVSSLDPALFAYETIGTLGALTVERAQRRLDPNAWITVYVLRDPKGGQIGLARAEISTLTPGEKPHPLSPGVLFRALKAQGFPIAEFEPAELPPGLGHFEKLLRETSAPRTSFGRGFQGIAASPGHGRTLLSRVTYDKAKAAAGGYTFVAAYTTPDDLDAIRASKSVITTSGGLLSHAAITTREMGIPAVILPGVEWKDGGAWLNAFDLGAPVKTGELVARPAKPASSVPLREDEVVRIDPASGMVEVFPRGTSAALLDAANALERFDATGDGAEFASWLTRRNTAQGLHHEQKAILVREALNGLFARALSDAKAHKALKLALAVLPGSDDLLGSLAKETLDARFAAEKEDAVAELKVRREIVAESLSSESIERLWRETSRRALGLRALAQELGRPKTELVTYEHALAKLKAEAQTRHEALIAEEMSELATHARLFPAATVEALPRIKSAIARAKRRKMNPDLIRKWEEQAATLEASRRASMEERAPAVLPLSAILDVDVPWVGGKAAKLGEIAAVVRAAGGEVPPGMALTVNAYRRFLRETGIAERLEAVGSDKSLTVEQRSEKARKLILGATLSSTSGVGKEILVALSALRLGGTPLAVRSSAVDEDGAEAAFAGAGDTHLYVDPAELLEHVKDVWASLWNPRALLYRETRGLSTLNLAQAVVVQSMVDSEVSGVAFTQDPVSGSSGRVIVNAAFGLGEGIVSGRVGPDQYVLAKTDGHELLPPMISDKKLAIVRGQDGKGTAERKMPPEWRRRRSMTPAKLKLLSDVSVALERHFGYALDIEFGFVGDKLYILQSRSVTTNGVEKKAPVPAVPEGSAMKPAVPKAKQLMFVCTGNTCRSPMAAHIAKEKLERHGRPDIEVVSRGLNVAELQEDMNPSAKKVLGEMGVDASGHKALQLTGSDVAASTLILTMTEAQAEEVRARYPAAKDKVFSLAAYTEKGGDIADPFGSDLDAYHAAATDISDALGVLVDGIKPGITSAPR